MRTPSPSYCRLDLAPPLADRFIFGVAPIDYGPVLLLMPFGFHLAMDTLPSGNCKRWLQVRLGCVQLSPSCPFRLLHTCLSPGPRGITPAFGYGAPHPSARGTSTLPINALLSAQYPLFDNAPLEERTPSAMLARLEKADRAFHSVLTDVRNRSAWEDTFVDALCEPPETFTFGGMFAHVITFNAYRRMVAIDVLRDLGVKVEGVGCPMEYLESLAKA